MNRPIATLFSLSLILSALATPPGGPPANDECTAISPVSLDIGSPVVFTGDNTGATTTNDAVPGTLLDQVALPNVWHAFTTTECADVVIGFCGTAPAFGNVWNLLATTCPADDNLVYSAVFNDTDCGDGNHTTYYEDLPAGTYYLPVLVDPFSSAEGPYTITVSAAACGTGVPANDQCADVTPEPLSVGGSVQFDGNNNNATTTNDAVPGSLLDQVGLPNVWHAFTTTECADVSIAFCGTSPAFGNVWHLLTTTCPADQVVYGNSNNNTDCGDGNNTTYFTDLPAGTYYLPVLMDPFNNAQGPYTILVSAVACASSPPANDDCSSVTTTSLVVGSTITFNGHNNNATTTNDAVPGTLLATVGLPNVWHAFTTTTCTDVSVAFCGTSPAFGNVWHLLATTCPADDNLVYGSSDDVACGDGNNTTFYDDLPAGTYYLPVLTDVFNNASGPYTIEVSAAACGPATPANDDCAVVAPVQVDPGSSIQFMGDNTNATLAGDGVPGSLPDLVGLPNVWHMFTTTECANVTIDFCGTTPLFGNTWNLLFVTCPADSVVFSTSNTDTICGDGNNTTFFVELAAGTYYLPVLMDPFNNAMGPYVITVSADSCLTTQVRSTNDPQWVIFPNPGDGHLQMVSSWTGEAEVELVDLAGRRVFGQRMTFQSGSPSPLDLPASLGSGTYTLLIRTESGPFSERILVR